MTVEAGVGLFFLGMSITICVMFIILKVMEKDKDKNDIS